MITCPNCKSSNLEGFATCSRCGKPLPSTRPPASTGGAAAPSWPAAAPAPSPIARPAPAPAPVAPPVAGGATFAPAPADATPPPVAPAAPGASEGGALPPLSAAPLGSGHPLGSGGGGMDEYQRLMAERNAKAKRNKTIGIAVLGLGLVAAVFFVIKDRREKAARQEKLEYFAHFVDLEKKETGAFWNCIMGTDVDVGMFSTAEMIQQRVESAYFTQQKTYSQHVTEECVPKIERAISAFSGLTMSEEYQEALDKYRKSLIPLKNGIEEYAEKIQSRAGIKDVDKSIQDTGTAFHSTVDPSPEGVAFEKFINCAIPDLQKKKDIQEVLEWLADTCYKGDALAFMTKVRADCGSLVTDVDKDAKPVPSKTWKATMKKFYEQDARVMQAWDACSRKSRKGKKVEDLEKFLTASGDYMEGRNAMQQAALKIQGSGEKKEGEGAEEGAAPKPAAAPKAKKH